MFLPVSSIKLDDKLETIKQHLFTESELNQIPIYSVIMNTETEEACNIFHKCYEHLTMVSISSSSFKTTEGNLNCCASLHLGAVTGNVHCEPKKCFSHYTSRLLISFQSADSFLSFCLMIFHF